MRFCIHVLLLSLLLGSPAFALKQNQVVVPVPRVEVIEEGTVRLILYLDEQPLPPPQVWNHAQVRYRASSSTNEATDFATSVFCAKDRVLYFGSCSPESRIGEIQNDGTLKALGSYHIELRRTDYQSSLYERWRWGYRQNFSIYKLYLIPDR